MHNLSRMMPRGIEPARLGGSLVFLLLGLMCFCVGCSGAPETPISDRVAKSALDELREAVQSQQWDHAKELSRAALIEQGHDPVALDLAASAAFQTGDRQLASELLLKAYNADQPASLPRISRTLAGLMSAGRYFDTLDLLRTEVERSPDNHEYRRLLIESLLGVEAHDEAAQHIESLVRARSFTVDTLISYEARHERTLETEVLETMADLQPSDLRPLIAVAKTDIDQGNLVAAKQTLTRIVSQHPQDARSQALLGRVLVYLEDYDAVRAWALDNSVWDELSKLPDVWLTLGDWAAHLDNEPLARHAYAKAAQLSDQKGIHRSSGPEKQHGRRTDVAPRILQASRQNRFPRLPRWTRQHDRRRRTRHRSR